MKPKNRLIWAAPVVLMLTLAWVALPTAAQPPWAGERGPGPHGRGVGQPGDRGIHLYDEALAPGG